MKYWSRYPVFRFLIPFGTGIVVNIYSEVGPAWFIPAGILFFLISFLFTKNNWATGKYAHRWLAGFPFYMLFFFLGAALSWMHTTGYQPNHFSSVPNPSGILAEVKSEPVRTTAGWRFEADVKSLRSTEGPLTPVRGKLLMSYKTVDSVAPVKSGNLILTDARFHRIQPPSNPGEFDYAFHMSLKGIYHRCYTDSTSMMILEHGQKISFRSTAITVRNFLLEILRKRIPEQEALGVAGALLLGYEDWLDPEVENDYAMSGVLHILCVSGMHVGLLYMVLGWLFLPMDKIKGLRHLKFTLFILIIWFYSMVTGFAPSIVRAATMFTFVLAGQWLERPNGIYNTLCASCFFMFLFDPFMIMAPGFQLSFLAVLGIVVLQRPLLYLFQPQSWIVFKIWELAAVSIAAQIATAPLSIFLFHQFPNYFLPANIIAVPLTTLGMYIGLFLFSIDWFDVVAGCTGTILGHLIQLVNEVIAFFGKLPGAITSGVSLSFTDMLLLYLIISLTYFWLTKKSFYYLRATMMILIVFMSFRILALKDILNTNQLIVHHVKGSDAVSLIQGGSALMIADSSFNDKHFQFSLEGTYTEKGVEKFSKITVSQNALYEIVNDKIIYINNFNSKDSIDLPQPEVLIIGGKCHPAIEPFIQKIKPDYLVLGSGFRMWKSEEMIQRLKASGIRIHQVKYQGAFIHEL